MSSELKSSSRSIMSYVIQKTHKIIQFVHVLFFSAGLRKEAWKRKLSNIQNQRQFHFHDISYLNPMAEKPALVDLKSKGCRLRRRILLVRLQRNHILNAKNMSGIIKVSNRQRNNRILHPEASRAQVREDEKHTPVIRQFLATG